MMNYNEFMDYVKEHVADYLPEKFANAVVIIQPTIKNNDVVLDGLTILNPDSNMSPNIYLNSFYEEYQRGRKLEDIVADVADSYIEHIEPSEEYSMNLSVKDFSDYEKIRDFIYPRVCNLDNNQKRLADVPYTVKEDLAITYHVKVNADKEAVGSFVIHNGLLKSYGVDVETIHTQAMTNMERISPMTFQPLSDLMVELLAPEFAAEEGIPLEEAEELIKDTYLSDGPNVYCLSNESKLNGAAYIMKDDVCQMVAEKLGNDYYILPSSVHEVLVMAKHEDMPVQEMQDMVQSVNARCVSAEEVLSNHIYQYEAKTHTFSRCDTTREMKYEHGQEKRNDIEMKPVFGVTESKGTYNTDMPKQTHEPMKHKAR